MSEIEKAREAREKGYGCADEIKNSDAAAEQSRRLSAQAREADLKEQMFERRVRAIVREEIEAAKSYKPQPGDAIAISDVSTRGAKLSAWTSDPNLAALICEHIDQFNALTPEQQEEHLRRQRESWVRGEMGLGLDNNRATINQEGGDANSPGRHERPATGLDKSPPAVEAPAAGDKGSSGALLAASHRDGYEAGKADTSALARRLAERMEWGLAVLKNVVAVDDVVGQSVIRLTEDVLTEARKAGLIE